MSALKRLHRMQQESKNERSQPEPSNLPASKRLKSSHISEANTYGAILDSVNRKKLSAVVTNGLPSKAASKVDETKARVGAGPVETINISSDEEEESVLEDDDEEDDDLEDAEDDMEADALQDSVEEEPPYTNGVALSKNGVEDVKMSNGVDEESDEEDAGEPSFGDMLKSRHPDIINLNALPDPHAEPPHLVLPTGKDALLAPVTGHSLSTVLQQALKTNDKDMLEMCFQLRDLQAVRNTIQRLPSPLVGNLLSRIAERMYKRPGRTGSLMIWIQWSLVAHGGYLATQPEVLRKLKALNQVIRQRAQGLQPLVQLKGKLDLLSAQLDLRRGLQTRVANYTAEEDGVLYVEGDDEKDWQLDEELPLLEAPPVKAQSKAKITPAVEDEDDEDDEEGDVDDDEEGEEAEAEEDEEHGMLDLEAEETGDDSQDSEEDEEENSDDASTSEEEPDIIESDESDIESEEEVKAPQLKTLNRKR